MDVMSEPTETMPRTGGATTLEREELTVPAEPGDHERFSHYAPKAKIMEAMVMGTPVAALCGKVWVPSRDPEKYPVCPTCKEIFEKMPEGPKDPKGPKE